MFALASFTGIGDSYTLQDAILLFIVVVHKTPYFTCDSYSYMIATVLLLYIGDLFFPLLSVYMYTACHECRPSMDTWAPGGMGAHCINLASVHSLHTTIARPGA